jgi:hypothetical protein
LIYLLVDFIDLPLFVLGHLSDSLNVLLMHIVPIKSSIGDLLIRSYHAWMSVHRVLLGLDRDVLRSGRSSLGVIPSLLEEMIVHWRLVGWLRRDVASVLSSAIRLVSVESASLSDLRRDRLSDGDLSRDSSQRSDV